jgi:hypothetical protein
MKAITSPINRNSPILSIGLRIQSPTPFHKSIRIIRIRGLTGLGG